MSDAVMFKDLPATFPEVDRFRKPSLASSVVFHVLLVTALIVFPLMFPRSIQEWQLMTMLVAPPPPPPAAPPAPVEIVAEEASAPKPVVPVKTEPDALVMPISVPKDIAHIVDEPVEAPTGVVGGVVGGVPGGYAGGVLSGVLAANAARAADMAVPPPPPPPPAPAIMVPMAPIRVGGNVREPRPVKLVPPTYPPLAVKARVSGTVVLEATLTIDGKVEDIRVISGHPLLVQAAITCVKQWVYEPTYLNGSPVEVILTAKVDFHQKIQ